MLQARQKQQNHIRQQSGQSMTQYLILMFVMTLGSLTAFGQFGQKSQHQVAMVAGEIAGKAGSSYSSTAPTDTSNTGNQSNSPYSGAGTTTGSNNPSAPNDTSSGNVVTQPGTNGPNTTPAVPNNSPPEVVTGNPVTDRTGQNNSQNTDNQATENTDTTDTTIPTGQTDLGAGTTTTETEPPPLCTKEGSDEATPTPAEDNGDTKKEEDKGFWGSLWSEVKDGLVAGYEFVKGFWEGMKKQVADLGDLLAHPIDTAKGLIELGKQFVKDPEGTAKMIADSLGDEFNTLVECGAFDKGRVIGENVSPAFMVKLASKMANFGDLAKALKATKKDFGCASFAAGTPIWTTDGKVNIETLIEGNTVHSRARKDFIDNPQKITNTFGRTADHYYQLTTEFETINVTAEHPLWKQGRGWTETQYLKVDNVVASADGDVLILDNKKIDKPLQVYNFSVENTPSYFAGKSKLWVHNAACDLTKPSVLGNGNLKDVPIAKNYPTATKGLLGEAKTNQILKDKGLTPIGDTNVKPDNLKTKDGWSREMTLYNGSTGIDGIFRGKDGKIYIVESKTTGVSEGCKAGSLCNTKSGKQMSRDWVNDERLETAGINEVDRIKILNSLENNDGNVVRLYSGTNAKGETRFYEIKDKNGSNSDVVVDRAGTDYEF